MGHEIFFGRGMIDDDDVMMDLMMGMGLGHEIFFVWWMKFFFGSWYD